jgi:hypothetical protein
MNTGTLFMPELIKGARVLLFEIAWIKKKGR